MGPTKRALFDSGPYSYEWDEDDRHGFRRFKEDFARDFPDMEAYDVASVNGHFSFKKRPKRIPSTSEPHPSPESSILTSAQLPKLPTETKSPIDQNEKRRIDICKEMGRNPNDPEYYWVRCYQGQIFRLLGSSFLSKYSGSCQLRNCKKKFVKGQTEIIGCELWTSTRASNVMSPILKRFCKNVQDKPYWICASHKNDYH